MSSIPLLATNTTVLCRVVKALYDAAPGYTYLQNFLSYANTNGINATVNALASNFSSQNNATLAATVCTNLGLTGTAYTAGVAYLTAQFNATTSANRGSVISDAMNALSALSNDATFGAAATAFNASVARSETFSTSSANTSTDLSVLRAADDSEATTTFDLTTSIATVSGTAGNDVFNGNTVNGSETFQAGDIVNGGAGTDTLSLVAGGGGGVAFLNGVEIVSLRQVSATQSFDTIGWSGVSQIIVDGNSTDESTLTITNGKSGSLEYVIEGDTNLKVTQLGQTGSSDIINVRLDGAGTSATDAVEIVASAIETLNIANSGTSFVDVSSDAVVTVNVSGAGTLDLEIQQGVSGVNMSGFSGTSNVFVDVASNVAVTGGAGNDTFRFGTTFNGLDTLNGGDGTDTLVGTLSGLQALRNVSNVETLSLTQDTSALIMDASGMSFSTISHVDMGTNGLDFTIRDNLSGAVTLSFAADNGMGDVAVDYAAGANAIITAGASAAQSFSSISVTDASGFTLNVVNASSTTTIGEGGLNFDGDIRAISLNIGGSGNLVLASAEGINASGATSLNIVTGASASVSGRGIGVSGGQFTSITIDAQGGATSSVTLGSATTYFSLATGTSTNMSVTASGGSTVFLNGVLKGTTSAGSDTLTVVLGTESNFGSDANGFTYEAAAVGNLDLDFTIGSSADAWVSAISVGTSGSIAGLDVSIAAGGTFDLSLMSAGSKGTVGNVNLAVAQSGSAVIDAINADRLGNINVTGSGQVQITSVVASGVGSISVGQGSASIIVSATTVGSVSLSGSGQTVSIDDAATIGSITLRGSGTRTVDVGSATTVGNIVVSDNGTNILRLESAENAITSTLGSGTNTLWIGKGGDVVTLTASTGRDTIVINNTGSDGATIYNFELVTGRDVISFGTAGFTVGLTESTSASQVSLDDTVNVLVASGTAVLTIGSSATLGAATDLVVIRDKRWGGISDLISGLASAGSHELQATTAFNAGEIMVAWADTNGNSYVTRLDFAGTATAGSAGILISAGATIDYTELVTLYGVDISSTGSGNTWAATFDFT